MSEEVAENPRNGSSRTALAIIFLIVFIDFLGFGIIIPLLPFYVPGYEASPLKVTLLFSIFSICQFFAAPILGAISDRHGRRPVLAFSQLGSAAGYILLGVATQFVFSPGTVLVLVYLSRIIDGISGGNVSTAQAYISDVTTPKNRAKGMALLGVAFGVGFSAGPAIGGILGHFHVSWPAYLAACLSALAAGLSFWKLPESREHRPVDVEAWLHPSTFAPVFRRPALVHLLFVGFAIMAAFVMMESTIGLFLAATFHLDTRTAPAKVGVFFAWTGLVIILVQGGLVRRLTKRMEWPLAIAGPLLIAAGMCGFVAVAWAPWVWLLFFAGAVNAMGRSLQQPTLSSLISKFSDPREQGLVFGMYHGLASIARVVGPVIAGIVYWQMRSTGAFITAGIIAVVVTLWTAYVRARYGSPGAEASPEAESYPKTEVE